MVDQDHFLGPQKTLGNCEGSNGIVGYHAAGIAEDMRVAFLEPEDLADMQAGVHAGQHKELLRRRQWKASFERLRIGLVVLQ